MPPQWPWSRKSSIVSSGESFPAGIKLMDEGKISVVDIIFIHGLTGDRERTWTAKNSSLPWIKTLLPSGIQNARIFTFGYDAYIADWRGMVSKNRVGNHSMNLITAVAAYRENDDTNTRPIIFVCHSLGGLVCKDALIASRQRPERHLQNIYLSTRAVAFLGTPHSGAGLADWAGKLARSIGLLKQTNAQIVAVLETDSEVLARIQDNFHTMIRSREQHGLSPIRITCFFEELPISGIGVIVPYHSAIIPGYTAIGIHKHHREMTKFERVDDPGFLAIVGELRRWTKELTMPNSTPESMRLCFQGSPREKSREESLISIEPQVSSFQLSNIGTGNSIVSQIVQQTFYSNVIRRSVGYYVARQGVQEELTRWLLSDSPPHAVVLCGIGGSGKTQLAIQCCREAEESGFLATLWVDASSPISVEQSYIIIARAIQKDFSDEDDIQTTISLVQNTLRNWPQRWLMVFDNYDNPKAFQARSVREYVPESKNGYIIFTSRHTGLEHLGGKNISASSMTKSEGLDLLLRRLPCDADEETEGLDVVDLLGHLALALDQAGAYIRARKLPLKEFKTHYEKRKDIIFHEIPDDWEYRNQSGPLSVFTTWEMSCGLIGGDKNIIAWKNDFLTLAGFFDPNRISERYFRAYCGAGKAEWMDLFRVNGEWDSYELGDVLAELHKLSLIQLPDQESGERSFTIHPIVSDWLVHRRGRSKRQQMTLELIDALAAFLKSSDEKYLSLEISQETTLHLDRCMKHEQVICSGGLSTIPETASLFARFYRIQGRYSEAERLLKQALTENESAFGSGHSNTLGIVESLGIICRKQGNYNAAEQLFNRALAGRIGQIREVLENSILARDVSGGEIERLDDVDMLRTMQNLANVYSDQGRYDDAEDLFEQVKEGMEANLGREHLETLVAGQNLANVYRKRGRYKDAGLLYQRALEAKEKRLGVEHPDTLGTVENLANVYRKQRQYMKAQKMFEQSLKSKEKKLGPEHPETLRAVQNLANVYSDQEQYDKAESLYQRALRGNEKVLGPEHPDTIRTVENLGILYSKASSNGSQLGTYTLAQQLLERAFEGMKKKRGPKHPDTLGSMDNLAVAHYRNREFGKAEELLISALFEKEEVLGKQHPDTIATVNNLGNVYYKLRRFEEAELQYKRVLDGKERLEQSLTLGTMRNLANIYRKLEQPDKAEDMMRLTSLGTLEPSSDNLDDPFSQNDVNTAQKKFDTPNGPTVRLPMGRLFLSEFKGRGLRQSGDPYVVCQFQGTMHISKRSNVNDGDEDIPGPAGEGRKDLEGLKSSLPIPAPGNNWQNSNSSDTRSFRTAPRNTKWIVNPTWDCYMSFDVFGDETELEVQIYDLSPPGKTFLGLARFDVGLFQLAEPIEEWYSLGSRSDEENSNCPGQVHLSIRFETTEKKTYGPEDFQITKLVGKGTHGQVYQVRKKDTGSIYALKVWKKKTISALPSLIPSSGFVAATKFLFQSEADLYLITDFLPGGELFRLLQQKGGRLAERCLKFYVAELVLAFQHLHKHSIIYRDLGPENILLDATGHITLSNFGLVRIHNPESSKTSFSGAAEYLAPEVLLDDKSRFAKIADFWTLGVLTWEMVCGWSPFYAEDEQQIYKNITQGKIRFPRDALSTDGRDFLRRLLNRNPEHRLGSVHGADELKRHPFLADVDWDSLAKKLLTPPFNPLEQPKVANRELASRSDEIATTFTSGLHTSTPFTLEMQANFMGFTFVDEGSLYARPFGEWDDEAEKDRESTMSRNSEEGDSMYIFDV